jgi:hypothetical protein
VGSESQTKFTSRGPQDIARAELERWRRRLGPLTHEQEVRIENLVISTAIKISTLTGQVMQTLLECAEKN